MPELVRPTLVFADGREVPLDEQFTPRERRLYIALAVILSFNLSIACAVLTFFGLLYGP